MSEAGRHLLGGFDTLYRALGESAPRFTHDPTVVWCYETGRLLGELTLGLRDITGAEPVGWGELATIMGDAVSGDESGALCVYAMTMLVGPRLLVTVRDLRDQLDGAERDWADRAATSVVTSLHAAGRLGLDPSVADEPAWAESARDLRHRLDSVGFGESFAL